MTIHQQGTELGTRETKRAVETAAVSFDSSGGGRAGAGSGPSSFPCGPVECRPFRCRTRSFLSSFLPLNLTVNTVPVRLVHARFNGDSCRMN